MRRALLPGSAVVALLVAASTFAGGSAELTNPSFESPDVPTGSYTNFPGGSAIGGWTVTGSSVAVVDETFQEAGFQYPAAAGQQWLDLTGEAAGNGGVLQSLTLSTDTQYTLSWEVGNNSGGSNGVESSVRLFIDGQPVRTVTNDLSGTTLQWQRFSQNFVPTETVTQIEFRNADPPSDQLNALDRISLTAVAGPPPPEVGETANAETVSGDVRVQLPKGGPFVPLSEAREIPIGAVVDTTQGTVKLTTARNAAGEVQSGKFGAGLFQVLQSRKRKAKGLTELRLKGSAAGFRNCGKKASASALSRRTVRRLRANAKGRYRTRGRHSAATVRGTKWVMEDRCDGTLTKVKRGKVVVRDFRLKKTVTVTAGKSYLAKAAD